MPVRTPECGVCNQQGRRNQHAGRRFGGLAERIGGAGRDDQQLVSGPQVAEQQYVRSPPAASRKSRRGLATIAERLHRFLERQRSFHRPRLQRRPIRQIECPRGPQPVQERPGIGRYHLFAARRVKDLWHGAP